MLTIENTITESNKIAHNDIQNDNSVVIEMANILKKACENGGLATATLKMNEDTFEARGYKALMEIFDIPENAKMEVYFNHVSQCEECFKKLSVELTNRNKERDYLKSLEIEKEKGNYYDHELKIKDWNY